MSKRVRTLLRVSSKQQLHDDDIPVQRAEAKQYIAIHSDWVFDKEYIEKAVSAYKNTVEDREVLKEIMEDAKKHRFDILLTYMSDRIGRKEEYGAYVAALNNLGIEVWTIKDGQLKTDEHIDKLMNYIRFWQNEGESKKTGARVRSAQEQMIKTGKFVGGKAPFGYELVPSGEISNHGRALKRLQIVEENAKVVRHIYGLSIQKGYGYDRIAKTLNEEGIPAITTDKWKAGTIASILKNPVYMGYPCINRRVNHGSFTRLDRKDWIYSDEQKPELVIINPADWEQAQQIREARKNKISVSTEQSKKLLCEQDKTMDKNVPITTKGKLALIGLAYCGYCGKPLKNSSYYNKWTLKSTEEKRVGFSGRYACSNKCAERAAYSQAYLEGVVFEVVDNYMESLKDIDIVEELEKIHLQQSGEEQKTIDKIRKEQKTIALDIETLQEKIPEALRGDGFFTPEQLAKLLQEKQEKLVDLQKQEKVLKSKLDKNLVRKSEFKKFISQVPNWKKEFQSADIENKKMLLSSLIDRIEVRDAEVKIVFKVRVDDYKPTHHTPDSVAAKPRVSNNGSKKVENTGENLVQKTIDSGTIPYILDSV